MNHGSEIVESDLPLESSLTTTNETSWESGWGITTGLKFSSEFKFMGMGSSLEFNLEVNFNGKRGGNKGTSKTISFQESEHVKVPVGKKVTANLVMESVPNAKIPFTATIRRTSEVGTTTFTEKGVWSGVLKFKTYIDVKESDL